MSAASSRGLPAMAKEPTARKVYAQLCSPDGSQDMETGGSHSSDEECSEVINPSICKALSICKQLVGALVWSLLLWTRQDGNDCDHAQHALEVIICAAGLSAH